MLCKKEVVEKEVIRYVAYEDEALENLRNAARRLNNTHSQLHWGIGYIDPDSHDRTFHGDIDRMENMAAYVRGVADTLPNPETLQQAAEILSYSAELIRASWAWTEIAEDQNG